MKFNYNILFISLMIVAVMSCDDDDNGGDAPAIVENDRTEQQVIDGDALLSYLSTHYYNSTTWFLQRFWKVKQYPLMPLY